MLTADMVTARRRKGELRLTALNEERRARALWIAERYVAVAKNHIGQSRAELQEAWTAVQVGARERKLALGIKKLIEDGLEFDTGLAVDAIVLRREVFERATARRRGLEEGQPFDREAVLQEIARERELTVEAIERGLYADLKGAHILRAMNAPAPAVLVDGFDLEQARAVLLRAVHLTARIHNASPDAVRALFGKLKFRRLLYSVYRDDDGSLRLEIDGPYSLFESVTKYGLQLALALPAIFACGDWEIDADVRWTKQRVPVRFRLQGSARSDGASVRVRDEVQQLHDQVRDRAKCSWNVAIADDIFELPGVGLCVPDLRFMHEETGEIVHLEIMGFWSRAAVWKRVELVRAGLETKILFAVSSRLRVSEQVLGEDEPGALYVYKGVIRPVQVLAKLDALIAR